MKALSYALVLCLSVGSPTFSQGLDIRGVVSDSATGDRIPYANVTIISLGKGSATNANGFYLIPSVAPGSYEIAASAVGYVRQVKRVVVQGDKAITVNFLVPPEPVRMEEVLVTGRGKRELSEISTSVHVLDKADLRMVPVTVQEDILRSILVLPGIVSTSDVNSQFYVRGGAADQNLILLDGMRIYNPFHAFGLFSIFDPDVVKTAEVYTGAFPADYGGRLSSVINIGTRDGNSSNYAARSNLNFLSSKAQLEGPVADNIQLIATGRKSLFSNTFKHFLKQSVPLSFYDGLLKLTFKDPNSQDRYSVQTFVSNDDLKSSGAEEPDYTWTNKTLAFETNTLLQNRLFVNTVISAGEFKQVQDPKSSERISRSSTSVKEFTVRANATYYTDSKDLYFFGFEFSFPNVEYDFVTRFGVPTKLERTVPQFSSWVRYQMRLGALQADGGLRTEIGSMLRGLPAKSAFQPRLNLSFDLGGTWKGKAAYGHFSQEIITVANEDDLIPIFNAWIAIPDYLEPEQADHFVLGIDGSPIPNLSTSVQGYYKHYSSLVSYNRDKVDATERDYINSTGKSYGAEALVRFSNPLLDLYCAYTLSWVKVNLNGFIYPPRYDRRHSLNLLASIHPLQGLDVSFRWEFGSGFPFTQALGFYDRLRLGDLYPNPFVTETGQPYMVLGAKNAARLPAYHRLDASIAYRVNLFSFIRSSIGINIINVYDRKNLFYFDRRTGQRINMLEFYPTANLTLEFLP